MGNDMICAMYHVYHNRKFIIWVQGSGFDVQGSGVAMVAGRPLIACERGSSGSIGSKGSKGSVRRIKIKSAAEV